MSKRTICVIYCLLLCAFPLTAPAGHNPPKFSKIELSVVETLEQVWFAQELLRQLDLVDVDGDLQGEYAYLAELGGAVLLRGSDQKIHGVTPAFPFSKKLAQIDLNGYAKRGKYLYALYLPMAGGMPTLEAAQGGDPGGLDPDFCEQHWVCYAWPKHNSGGNKHTFAINEDGVVVATNGAVVKYDGYAAPPLQTPATPVVAT